MLPTPNAVNALLKVASADLTKFLQEVKRLMSDDTVMRSARLHKTGDHFRIATIGCVGVHEHDSLKAQFAESGWKLYGIEYYEHGRNETGLKLTITPLQQSD